MEHAPLVDRLQPPPQPAPLQPPAVPNVLDPQRDGNGQAIQLFDPLAHFGLSGGQPGDAAPRQQAQPQRPRLIHRGALSTTGGHSRSETRDLLAPLSCSTGQGSMQNDATYIAPVDDEPGCRHQLLIPA